MSKPSWFREYGECLELQKTEGRIELSCEFGAVHVGLLRASLSVYFDRKGSWVIEWEIAESEGVQSVRGARVVDTETFLSLLGTNRSSYQRMGLGIRVGLWASFPGPGMNHVLDPNICVHVRDEIAVAVTSLVADEIEIVDGEPAE